VLVHDKRPDEAPSPTGNEPQSTPKSDLLSIQGWLKKEFEQIRDKTW
jgi:hypothetical protein